jgi:hypothetical protein
MVVKRNADLTIKLVGNKKRHVVRTTWRFNLDLILILYKNQYK